MQPFLKGDVATLIRFYIMTPEQAVETSFLSITVNQDITVSRATSRGLTLSGRTYGAAISNKQIGTPVKVESNNSYAILVPKGEPAEPYIAMAKDMMKDSIQQSQYALRQALKNTHKAIDNESEWLVSMSTQTS